MEALELIVVAIIVAVLAGLILKKRQIEAGQRSYSLRSLSAFRTLRHQVGMALESGNPPLLALGRGPLHSESGPTSIAGLAFLRELASSSDRGQLTPRVAVGSATLLPIAQDVLKQVTEENAGSTQGEPSVQFIADETYPLAYAAGTANEIERDRIAGSIAVGRFGAELAIIGEAASRNEVSQVMASDNPDAIAVAIASTKDSLWGEEIFAAAAYLRQSSWDLAAVRIQDLLRLIVIAFLLGATFLRLLGLI